MTHHLTADPIVIRRDGVIRFIDWDFGFRTPRSPSEKHELGWRTRRALPRSLARDLRELL